MKNRNEDSRIFMSMQDFFHYFLALEKLTPTSDLFFFATGCISTGYILQKFKKNYFTYFQRGCLFK